MPESSTKPITIVRPKQYEEILLLIKGTDARTIIDEIVEDVEHLKDDVVIYEMLTKQLTKS